MSLRTFKIICFSLSAIGALLFLGVHCLALIIGRPVHVSTFFDNLLSQAPFLLALLLILIAFYLPNEKIRLKSLGIETKIFWPFANAPFLLKAITFGLVAYSFIFLVTNFANITAIPIKTAEGYFLANHGKIIGTSTLEAYALHLKKEQQALSVIFSAVCSICYLVFYPKNLQ